jgi:hypothetical protein
VAILQNPKINDWSDLFPFLFKRCGENLNHRIIKLATSMNNALCDDSEEAPMTYNANADVQSEFPDGALLQYLHEIPSFGMIMFKVPPWNAVP